MPLITDSNGLFSHFKLERFASEYPVLSWFSGAGGMDQGFHQSGFDVIEANVVFCGQILSDLRSNLVCCGQLMFAWRSVESLNKSISHLFFLFLIQKYCSFTLVVSNT